MKVLIINASPRKYGGVTALLTVAEEAARAEGAETEVIYLYDLDIGPCIGCVSDVQEACRYPCVIDDDGREVLRKIVEADGVIIGTPIYWYGPSGPLKDLIDRMTSLENMAVVAGRSLVEGKPAGFIAVGNDSGAIMTIAYLMVTFNSMGFTIPPWALAYHNSMDNPLSSRSAVEDAANVGALVVRMIKSLGGPAPGYDPGLLNRLGGDAFIEKVRERMRSVKENEWRMRKPRITRLLGEGVGGNE